MAFGAFQAQTQIFVVFLEEKRGFFKKVIGRRSNNFSI